jgi:heme-degrading monooxygenase HmoA
MVVRIVRMYFLEEGVEKFLEIFHANKIVIRNFSGCTHLELMRDAVNPNVLTTVSHWQTTADLEAYRNSGLFSSVWTGVRKQFAARPEAFTLIKFLEV